MIERVHEHIIEELNTNTRTDTIFVVAGIMLNLVLLGVNTLVAKGGTGTTTTIVMFILVALLVVINVVVELGLIKGRQTRAKLLNGLLKMYKDQGVDGYYDPSLLGDYGVRYNLFMLVVIFTGLVALIIPFVVR